jgi:hypothetical protein
MENSPPGTQTIASGGAPGAFVLFSTVGRKASVEVSALGGLGRVALIATAARPAMIATPKTHRHALSRHNRALFAPPLPRCGVPAPAFRILDSVGIRVSLVVPSTRMEYVAQTESFDLD